MVKIPLFFDHLSLTNKFNIEILLSNFIGFKVKKMVKGKLKLNGIHYITKQ